ncbi:MAG: aminodeoxychorismate synthase component I [Chloroflexota bacterium]
MKRILLIDNYDSYTFNLYQMLAMFPDCRVDVIRNDEAGWPAIHRERFDCIVISPGPGSPCNDRDFGVCGEVLLAAEIPVLGVCLGHQGLAYMYGGEVTQAPIIMHGKLSRIFHCSDGIFRGIPQGFSAVRYHSLVVTQHLPESLEATAWTADGIVMGIHHKQKPLWGVQFHPEAICSEHGNTLVRNFLELAPRVHTDAESDARYLERPSPTAQPGVEPMRLRLQVEAVPSCKEPGQLFADLYAGSEYAFWLDSSVAEAGQARFSIMGAPDGALSQIVSYRVHRNEVAITDSSGLRRTVAMDIFEWLKQTIASFSVASPEVPFDFVGGFVGYLGYELNASMGAAPLQASEHPDALLLFIDRFLVVDHEQCLVYVCQLVVHGASGRDRSWRDRVAAEVTQPSRPQTADCQVFPAAKPPAFRLRRGYQAYLADIELCKRELREGNSYELCLTNEITGTYPGDPFALYADLRQRNPAPYSAYLRFNSLHILCSSPERFLKIDRSRIVEAKPIKGTRPRGRTQRDDARLRCDLASSVKDRAENMMIVDLLRNDLGRVCTIGSVCVPRLMSVETYSTVHQLVSTIQGELRADLSPVDCIAAAFPAGSMTGAPKLRAMEILDRIERHTRGIYSGSIGFISLNETIDLNVVIRTIILADGELSIGVGGAIVLDSHPEDEFAEMMLKGQALLEAVASATCGQPTAYDVLGAQPKCELKGLRETSDA